MLEQEEEFPDWISVRESGYRVSRTTLLTSLEAISFCVFKSIHLKTRCSIAFSSEVESVRVKKTRQYRGLDHFGV
ncbi:MAG: hypothetical protein KDJ29_19065, partial [Hyphomicrobiales bacterium]|nr:hypothetical protein [Hyphomicrobiales bacterium]